MYSIFSLPAVIVSLFHQRFRLLDIIIIAGESPLGVAVSLFIQCDRVFWSVVLVVS